MQSNKGRLHSMAQKLEETFDTFSELAGRIKAKVEALTRQAQGPPATQPEDLSAEFAELDAALDNIGRIPDSLRAVAEGSAGGGAAPTGSTAAQAGGTVAPTSPPNPVVQPGPTTGAPGMATTPTGSHETGPGGGGPEAGEPTTAFPTTESGQPAQDASISSAGQGSTGGASGVVVSDGTPTTDVDAGGGQ